MRLIHSLAIAGFLLASPSMAAEWTQYSNARFGYTIAVPPGFSLQRRSENSDGAVFSSSDGEQTLAVWGSFVADENFAGDLAARITADKREGWNVTYRAEATSWVTYSGTRGRRVLYARSVSTCGGAGSANFRLEYDADDIEDMNDEVMRLARSLRPGSRC